MRTIEIKIVKFEELDDKGKKKAIEEYRNNTDYHWINDNDESLKEFAKRFNLVIKDYDYGYGYGSIRFDTKLSDDVEQLNGLRLWKYLYNNHLETIRSKDLTGYCCDYSLIQPLEDYMKKPNLRLDYVYLMRLCLDAWIKYCREDYEECQSDDYIIEQLMVNDYEYTTDGRMYL